METGTNPELQEPGPTDPQKPDALDALAAKYSHPAPQPAGDALDSLAAKYSTRRPVVNLQPLTPFARDAYERQRTEARPMMTSPPLVPSDVARVGAPPNSDGDRTSVASAVGGMIEHPLMAAGGMVQAPFTLGNYIGQGINRVVQPENQQAWEAQHGQMVSGKEAALAGAQTAAMGLGGVAGQMLSDPAGIGGAMARGIGSGPAGFVAHGVPGAFAGAAFMPEHPAGGAALGFLTGGLEATASGTRIPSRETSMWPVDRRPSHSSFGQDWGNRDVYDGQRVDINRETNPQRLLGSRGDYGDTGRQPTARYAGPPEAEPTSPDFTVTEDAQNRATLTRIEQERARMRQQAEELKKGATISTSAPPEPEGPDYETLPRDELDNIAKKYAIPEADERPRSPGFDFSEEEPAPAPPENTARDATGKLRANLSTATVPDLEAEWQRLVEQNAREEHDNSAVQEAWYRHDYTQLPNTEKFGHRGKEDLPDADGMVDPETLLADNATAKAYNRSKIVRDARQKAIARLEAELERRNERAGLQHDEGDTSFDIGSLSEHEPEEGPERVDLFGNPIAPTVKQGDLFAPTVGAKAKAKGAITPDEMAARRDELGAAPNAAEKTAGDNLSLFERDHPAERDVAFEPRRGGGLTPEEEGLLNHWRGAGLPTSEQRLAAVRGAKLPQGWKDLRGHVIDTPEKAYHALAAWRSPLVEKLHEVLLNDKHEVLAHTSSTSNAVNSIDHLDNTWVDGLIERAKRVGATEVMLGHNHPSGNPTPSGADFTMTAHAARRLADAGLRLAGHIVTDHDQAVWIHAKPTAGGQAHHVWGELTQVPGGAAGASWLPANAAGTLRVRSPADVARVVATSHRPDALLALYLDQHNHVLGIEHRPPTSGASIGKWVPQMLRAHGAVKVIIAGRPEGLARLNQGAVDRLARARQLSNVIVSSPLGVVSYEHQGWLPEADKRPLRPRLLLREPAPGGPSGNAGGAGPAGNAGVHGGGPGGVGATGGAAGGTPPGGPPGVAAAGGSVPPRGNPPPHPLKVQAAKFAGLLDDLRKLFAADTRGPASKMTGAIIRQNRGWLDRADAQAREATRSLSNAFDRLPEPTRTDPTATVMANPRMAFIDKVESGTAQGDPTMDRAATVARAILDQRRAQVQALGTNALRKFYDNYFPHMWEDPVRAANVIQDFISKRPFEGSKSFLKQRTMMTTADGIDAGLWPRSTNPMDLVLMKAHEMGKYIEAHRSWQELKDKGLIVFAPPGRRMGGWSPINDNIAKIFGGAGGQWLAPEPVAHVFNQNLAPGIRGNGMYDIYMSAANGLNLAQLGLSWFHGGLMTMESSLSDIALAGEQLSHGRAQGVIPLVRGAVPFASLVNDLRVGQNVLSAYLDPTHANPIYRMMAEQVERAGGRAFMDQTWDAGHMRALAKDVRTGKYGAALARALPAGWEAAVAPIMRGVVPRVKLAAFGRLALEKIQQLGANPTPEQTRVAVQEAWNSIDNRAGQYVYRNKFWNPYWKDGLHAAVRATGWTGGTIGEIGGGTLDVARMGRDALTGKMPKMTSRTWYTVALVLGAAWFGGLLGYFLTGKTPETLRDLYYPRTGKKNSEGNDERLQLPTYMRDVQDWTHHPGRTAINKLNPAVHAVAEMLQNRDFYGNKIFGDHHDAPASTKAKDWSKELASYAWNSGVKPFTVRNFEESGKRQQTSGVKALSYLGVTPASREATRSDAQNRIMGLLDERGHTPAEPGQAQTRQDNATMKQELRAHDPAGSAAFGKQIAAGNLSARAAKTMIRSSLDPVWTERFKQLSLPDAFDVFKHASPTERAEWRTPLLEKIQNANRAKTLAPKDLPLVDSVLRATAQRP